MQKRIQIESITWMNGYYNKANSILKTNNEKNEQKKNTEQ